MSRKPPLEGSSVLSFPEPPRRRRRRRVIVVASVTGVSVLLLMLAVIFTPLLQIRDITIDGEQLAAPEAVAEALAPLKGKTLIEVSDAEVRERVKDLPMVKDIEAAAVPPSTLHVTVKEYVPVAVLEQNGSFVLIDDNGRKLHTVKDRSSVKLPLIDGGSAAVDSEVFSSITAVLASLPAEVLAKLEHASADSVDSVELKLEDGRRVFWGSAEKNAAKAGVLHALLRMAPSDPPVKVFDVSTPERPVTRTE